MKTSSSAALAFSNSLRVIEDNVLYLLMDNHLKIVRTEEEKQMSSATSNKQVNDPGNWDAAWFANYE